MRSTILVCLLVCVVGKTLRNSEPDRVANKLNEINLLQAQYWTDGDESHLSKIFSLIDSDGDGTVSRGEVLTALQSGHPSLVSRAANLVEQFQLHGEDKTFDIADFVWTAGMASSI